MKKAIYENKESRQSRSSRQAQRAITYHADMSFGVLGNEETESSAYVGGHDQTCVLNTSTLAEDSYPVM